MNVLPQTRLTKAPLDFGTEYPGVPRAEPDGEQVTAVVRLLSILRRRKWVILATVLASILAGVIVTLLMTPRYTAVATVEIQQEGRNFTQVEGAEEDAQGAGAGAQEFYQTQYGLLRSRSLANRVATDLRLYDNPAFFEMFGVDAARGWFANGRPVRSAPARDDRIRSAATVLLANFEVEPMRGSRLVQIKFEAPDPVFAKRVVDGWSAGFIRSTLARRYESTAYARNFLEQRLAQLRNLIDASERNLVAYATREGIVNLPQSDGTGASSSGERSLVAEDLVNLNQELARATADRVRAESRLASSTDAATEALGNGAMTGLRQRRAELSAEYARLLVQFEPRYPQARALQAQIERIDRALAAETGRVRENLQDSFDSAVQRERALQTRVSSLKSGVLDLRRRSIQYGIYQREADTNRQLYDALLQRYKEIGVAGGVGVNNIAVVDQAEVPTGPSSPRLLLNLLISVLAGLLGGGVLAFLLEQLDRGVTDPQDVERVLGTPLIGTVPKITTGTVSEALADRKSGVSEAYQTLRANLAFSTDHGVPRALAVTSSRPAEGKTTTTHALALAIARMGRSVVLVDADMRSPSVHHHFGLENVAGLSNYLSGDDAIAELLRPTGQPGLSTMTSGPVPPSAPELLASDRLAQLVTELRQRFEHVLIDMPPVMGLADAPLIAGRVEGVVFVIEANGTHRSMASVAVNRLRTAGAHVVGTVVTKFDAKRAHYGYGYEYGYGHRYGETASKTAG